MEMIKTLDLIKENILRVKEVPDNWSIYGTGNGAEMIWQVLAELGCTEKVRYIFDNKQVVLDGKIFHGHQVTDIEDGQGEIELILVGAEYRHRLIYERLAQSVPANITIIDPFRWNITEQDKDDYIHYVENFGHDRDLFVPISERDYEYKEGDPKVIAWYLPQFHQMEINNKYHGQGFTEWTNTTRTLPQFTGHDQPQIPYDVGYYDLLNPDTFKRQIYLAKKYGVYGFGFFYYWYPGFKIMEKPLELLLEHKELDIPFCFYQATEDWSMSWYDVHADNDDSKQNKVVIKQELPDAVSYWNRIVPFFRDDRYIKIENRPLLIVYQCTDFQKEAFKGFLDDLRRMAKKEGFPDLYIMLSTGNGTFEDADSWSGDALVEYQPWKFFQSKLIEKVLPRGYLNPNFIGRIADIRPALQQKDYLPDYKCRKYFRSALAAWDNSARKKETDAIIMLGNTPEYMKEWLIDIISESKKIHSKEEHMVFVSSWNEWAEASHLEPDYRYGYAWLQAVRDAIEECREMEEEKK